MSTSAVETYKQLIQYRPGNELPEHEGDSFRFHFFEKGAGRLELNGNEYSLISPCLLCLSERDIAEYKEEENAEHGRIHTIVFKPALINSSFDFETLRKNEKELRETQGLDIYWLYPFLREDGPRLIGPSTAGRLLELLHSLAAELREQKGDFWPCRSRSYFYELLNIVSHIHSEPRLIEAADARELDPDTRNVIAYLNANYHRKIAIGDLTERFQVNRTSLAERFQKSMGMSVMNYLTEIRIRMACLLLRDTTLPVSELMERVGYEDSTHFGRTFRNRMGLTPSKYREENRWKSGS